jgi:menaquinone-dependent protoporphyrinogen oxidase
LLTLNVKKQAVVERRSEGSVMTRVLVVYASRHGGTRGIAERIGEVLSAEGLESSVAPAAQAPDVDTADGVVIGSGVYMGSWLKEALEFVRLNEVALATRPVWLFSSGPLRGSTRNTGSEDPVTEALGPVDGPGSGGRKKVTELSDAIHPRGHRVFDGAYDPTDPPGTMAERIIRMMPRSKNILPSGDFRDWPAIEAWAREISEELRLPVAAG